MCVCVLLYQTLFIFFLQLIFVNSSVYQECLDKWRAIVVDEFQDTSSMQYRLLRILTSHNHVTIVGDEDQVRQVLKNYVFVSV